jgi:hypothetical protein
MNRVHYLHDYYAWQYIGRCGRHITDPLAVTLDKSKVTCRACLNLFQQQSERQAKQQASQQEKR